MFPGLQRLVTHSTAAEARQASHPLTYVRQGLRANDKPGTNILESNNVSENKEAA